MKVDFRHSILTGASCWLAAMAAFRLHCGDPWYAVISAWVISATDVRATFFKGVLRIAGTFAGYLVGSECVRHFAGNLAGEVTAMFLIGACGTCQRFRSRYSYAWVIGAVTALMLVALAVNDPESVYETAHYRVYEIISGVIAAMVCQRLLGPLLGLTFARGEGGGAGPEKTASHGAPGKDLVITAVIGGLLPGMILLLWARFHLPSLIQIILTSFVTIDRDVAAARLRATQRILGCLLGGALGCLVVWLGIHSLPIWSLFLAAGVAALSQLHLSKGGWSYAGTQGGVAFILSLVTGDQTPDSILPVVNRIAGMISGVLILNAICTLARLWKREPDAAMLR